MKAITIVKPGQVEIREIEKPVRGKDEAILQPIFGGICGSDDAEQRRRIRQGDRLVMFGNAINDFR